MPKTWTDQDLIREALNEEAKRRRTLSDRVLKDSTSKIRPSQIVALQRTAIRMEELARHTLKVEDDPQPLDEIEDETLPETAELAGDDEDDDEE
jgi:hypothetical protein